MAFIEITGTVTRIFHGGRGVEVVEVFEKRDGSEGKSKFTLWFADPAGLSEGDSGSWRGSHSVKVDEWTDKQGEQRHSAVVSINGAQALSRGKETTGAVSGTHTRSADSGASRGNQGSFGSDESTPF